MTPEQFNLLLAAIVKLADKSYTLTGAADWPILAFISGGAVVLIGMMWADLRGVVKDNKNEWKAELAKHEADNKEAILALWRAHTDCQHDCCPRGRKDE